MRHTLLLAVLLLAAGCGNSPETPTAPSPTPTPTPPQPTLTGTWVGRMTFTFQGDDDLWFDTRVTLNQSGSRVTGDWVVTAPADNDVRGTLTGSIDGAAQFAGTITVSAPYGDGTTPAADGSRCIGSGTFSGTTTQPMRWQSSGFVFENCIDGPTDITWILNR